MWRHITVVAIKYETLLFNNKQRMYRLTCFQVGPHGVAELLNTVVLHNSYDVLSLTSRYDMTNVRNVLVCIGW